jgi:hypothetical protein
MAFSDQLSAVSFQLSTFAVSANIFVIYVLAVSICLKPGEHNEDANIVTNDL